LAEAGTAAAAAGIGLANQALTLAQSGTIDANDAALFTLAWTGTATANVAYGMGQAGTAAAAAGINLANTALVLAEAGTLAAAIAQSTANSANVTANQALYTANVLSVLVGSHIGVLPGTNLLYTSQVRNADRTDIQITVFDGVIVGVGTSSYGVETFENYALGTIYGNQLGNLGAMSSWYGSASLIGPNQNPVMALTAFQGTDGFVGYALGTVFVAGTNLGFQASPLLPLAGTLSGGYNWGSAWTAGTVALNYSEDNLMSYSAGSIVWTTGSLNGGTNWGSYAAIFG
jgi:hypothetical protein